jgi:hypothetical protein
MDADDQDVAANDAPAKTQDADAKPTAVEQHVALCDGLSEAIEHCS